MSGTTEDPEAGNIAASSHHPPAADSEIGSATKGDGETTRDPRETLKMKRNIESFFRRQRS